MGFQEVFPEVLSRTYPNCCSCKDFKFPSVFVTSKIFGNKLISLPFLDTVKISSNLNEKDLENLIKTDENSKIEIRLSESDLQLKKTEILLQKNKFHKNVVKGHIISELTSKEDFWNRFHKHTRNDIRKAEKSNLIIRKIDNLEELKRFYRLYLQQMKIFGTPQHSFKFFKNCFEIMKNDFYGLNCYFKNKLIGSIILFIDQNYAYVPFNISNSKYRNLRVNDLIYWEAIQECINRKIRYFDIGQVDLEIQPNTREESLFKFKNKWLGKTYKRIYFTRNFEHDSSKKGTLKKFRIIWRRLPTFLIKVIGPKICSQLG